MDNLFTEGKKVAGLAMPSHYYVDLSVVQTSVSEYFYTVPANGYFTLSCVGHNNGTVIRLYRNDVRVDVYNGPGEYNGAINCACKSGDVLKISVTHNALKQIKEAVR
jgi:hypothetical protein